jgi:hypothetical protein
MISISHFGQNVLVPLAITAQARHSCSDLNACAYGSRNMHKEQRMLLCVILQAIAEQDTRFVLTKDKSPKSMRLKARLAQEARHFVESEEYADMVAQIGLPPELLEKATPEQAWEALSVLANPSANLEEATEAVLARNQVTTVAA